MGVHFHEQRLTTMAFSLYDIAVLLQHHIDAHDLHVSNIESGSDFVGKYSRLEESSKILAATHVAHQLVIGLLDTTQKKNYVKYVNDTRDAAEKQKERDSNQIQKARREKIAPVSAQNVFKTLNTFTFKLSRSLAKMAKFCAQGHSNSECDKIPKGQWV